ncbi:MAG: ABC transporter permease [Archangiaceae bacterium]|nr:ABC transporter permease [Archangiaceae bacterium]
MSRLPALALRNVRRHRRRSLLTVLAVALGMAAVVLLRGVSAGFVGLMMELVVDGRTGAIQIHQRGYVERLDALPTTLAFAFDEALRERIVRVPGVRGAAGRIRFDGSISNGSTALPFIGRGVDPATEGSVCPGFTAAGEGVVLGVELAETLAARHVTLEATGPTGRVNAVDLEVSGTSATRLPFENKRSVGVSLELARTLLGMPGLVTEVAVGIDGSAPVETVAARLREALGPSLEVHTWRELEPYVRDTLRRQGAVIDVVALVLLFIVLSSIASTTTMSVHERTGEIGTLLALGLKRRQILTLFLLEASVLGGVGALLGALVGALAVLALGARGVTLHVLASTVTLRPVVDLRALLLGVVVCAGGAVVAAAWQARRASRLDPVDALRAN